MDRCLAMTFVVLSFVLPGALEAQRAGRAASSPRELSPSDRMLARELFRQGMSEIEVGNWTAASQTFERLYQLTGRTEVLLNLATAQARSGLLVEAAESYRTFLRNASAELRAQHGEAAQAELDALMRRIGRLRVTVEQMPEEARVLLDGTPLDAAQLDLDRPINPGLHEAVLVGPSERELDRQRVEVAEGATARVTLRGSRLPNRDVAVVAADAAVEAARADASSTVSMMSTSAGQDSGDDSTGWVVGLVLGGVVLVGAGVGLAVGLSMSATPMEEPFRGTLGAFIAF